MAGGGKFSSSGFFGLSLLGGLDVLLFLLGVAGLRVGLGASAGLKAAGTVRCTSEVWAFTNDALRDTEVVVVGIRGSTLRAS